MGPKREPGSRRRPPNSNQEPTPNTHQLEGGGKRCDRIRAHEVGHGQDVLNHELLGTGREVDPGLTPQAEPFLLQISHQNIQEEYIIEEDHQNQKNPPPCCLFIWEVPQEAMEYQSQTLILVTQEALGDRTQGHDLNRIDDLCPTRGHPPSQWGSNPCDIMGSHYICESLLQLLLRPPHEGNLSLGNNSVQEGL